MRRQISEDVDYRKKAWGEYTVWHNDQRIGTVERATCLRPYKTVPPGRYPCWCSPQIADGQECKRARRNIGKMLLDLWREQHP